MANPATYTCHFDPWANGTHLKAEINTSVFFENANTNANWKKAFSNPIRTLGARDYVNGLPKIWPVEDQITQSGNCGNWPPGNAITGSLVNDAEADFWKGGIPLAC